MIKHTRTWWPGCTLIEWMLSWNSVAESPTPPDVDEVNKLDFLQVFQGSGIEKM